jgi:hypothetical protein
MRRPFSRNGSLLGVACLTLASTCPGVGAQDPPAGEPSWTSVKLSPVSGAEILGQISAGGDGAVVLQSPAFDGAIPLRLEAFKFIDFTGKRPALEAPTPRFMFELSDGARLAGSVVAITGSEWRLATELMGEVTVPLGALRRVEQVGEDGVLYRGPTSFVGWSASGRKNGWVFEERKLVAKGSRAILTGSFGALETRPITLTLGWKGEPLFRVGLGVKSSVSDGVVIEAWGSRLVAWRDTGRRLEYVELPGDLTDVESITLRARIAEGRITFFDADGAALGSLARGERVGEMIQLACDGLGLEVHELSIGARAAPTTAVALLLEEVSGFDHERGEFQTPDGGVPARHVASLERSSVEPNVYAPLAAQAGGAPVLRLVHAHGSEVTGVFVVATPPGDWRLQVPWSDEPVQASMQGLARIEVQSHAIDLRRYSAQPDSSAVTGRGTLAGMLVGVDEAARALFQPTFASEAIPLRKDGLERLVFNKKSTFFAPGKRFPHLIHLRSGETFRAKVTEVGPGELTLEASIGDTKHVPLALVKAIDVDPRTAAQARDRLAPEAKQADEQNEQMIMFGGGALPPRRHEAPFRKESLELALALPRKYKDRPPTHLIVGPNGDFLRTSVVSLSPAGAEVATRAVTEQGEPVVEVIPADRISTLVWLAPDPVAVAVPDAEGPGAPRLIGRVTIDDEHVLDVELVAADGRELRLRSAVLGEFSLPYESVLQLELDAEPEPCFYSRWVLTPMPEPRMAQ